MFTTAFIPAKMHNYAKARVDGKWFEVSHFMKDHDVWHVWLRADHGVMSGFVECRNIAEWEVAE